MTTKQPEINADDIGSDIFLDPDQAPQEPTAPQPKTKSQTRSREKASKTTDADSPSSVKGTYYLPPDVNQMLRQAYSHRVQNERRAKINDIIVEALRKYLPKLLRGQSSES